MSFFAGDALQNVCAVEWTSDQDIVVLEVLEDGAKQGKDTEPTTIKELMEEFEEQGLEYTLNNHDCVRREIEAEGQEPDEGVKTEDANGAASGYAVTPKKTKVYFQYTAVTSNLKHSNVASCFPVEVFGLYTITWKLFTYCS